MQATTSFSCIHKKRRKGSYNKFQYGQQDDEDDDDEKRFLYTRIRFHMCNRVLMRTRSCLKFST